MTKILALPKNENPYQRLLYKELKQLGVEVSYLGEVSPSHTLNVLLLPMEMLARRLRGRQVVHLHWVFVFSFPGARRFPLIRLLGQYWFVFWLWTVRFLGFHLVWTAHNVLPHSQIFTDDIQARRSLVSRCDLVFAHSPSTLAALAELNAAPRRSLLIRHGPLGPEDASVLRKPGTSAGPREFLFFGRIERYKGVEELLRAFERLPDSIPARLTIAGQCDDAELSDRLTRAKLKNIKLRLARIPDDEIAELMAAADIVALPFREVTTSGSAELALAYARPLIVPDLPGLAGLPADGVLRYDGSIDGLCTAVAELALADESRLDKMSAAALRHSSEVSWQEIAAATFAAVKSLLQ